MIFPYQPYGHGFYRPVIPIILYWRKSTIQYNVLVDSGSDICLFDSQVADLLSLDISKGLPNAIAGLDGKSETYYMHRLIISLGRYSYSTTVGFLERNDSRGYGIVGHRGFFDHFTVKFDTKKKELDVRAKK